MISVKYALIIVAAFAAGSFFTPPVQQAIAAVIATDVQCTGCVGAADLASSAVTSSKIGTSAVTTVKLNGGSVTNAKLADGAVTTSKITDGSIKYADVNHSFIAVEHRDDCDCGGTGWDPDGTLFRETIYDSRITGNSVVSVSLANAANWAFVCWTQAATGQAQVRCDTRIPQGLGINYSIFNQ